VNLKKTVSFKIGVGLLMLASLISACDPPLKEVVNNIDKNPNIIYIFTDDMSYYDLSSLGQKHFSTPNIDKLLEEGLFFNEAYAGSSECAPSRASLLTGKHMGHSRIRNNRSVRGQENLLKSDITVAEMLKKAGYTTGMVGKWGVGVPGTEGTPDKQGFDYSFGFYDQLRAHGFYPHYLMENGEVVAIPENYGFDMQKTYAHTNLKKGTHTYDKDGKLLVDGVPDPRKAINSQDYIQSKALQFIKNSNDSPFFLYYATQLPHGPVISPDISKFINKPWSQKHKEWAAMMEHLDRHVGEIVQTLDSLSLRENTIIFFSSDHGYSQYGYFGRKPWVDDPLFNNKGPWKAGKFLPMDGGVRVPFFANWPGKIKPGISNEVVSLYDFFATACDLVGITSSESDGKSLLPLFKGDLPIKIKLHPYLYWENGSMGPHAQSTRFRNWFAFRKHPDDPIQLWDLSKDITCDIDVADSNPAIVKEAISIFVESHENSQWYVNPGETKEEIDIKRKKAAGSIQKSTFANSRYPNSIKELESILEQQKGITGERY